MKANNILVEKTDNKHEGPDKWYRYSLGSHVFIIPGIGIQIKIWDFDFASIDGIVENKKVNADWTKKINISKKKNMYYDMHYFFNTLISKRFFPQFYEGGVPQEIVDFVHRIVPEEFRNGSDNINKKGRILVDVEYTTPFKVIMTDPLFEKYRYNQYYFHPQRNMAPKKSILFQQGNGSKQPVPKKSTGQKPTKKV
ncbi:S/T protein kinase [Acanthamoeba polyphaga mimivirus]|nr:S/T protein kinase [Acanthamoeba polyphaga mimivirus]